MFNYSNVYREYERIEVAYEEPLFFVQLDNH